MSNLAAQGCQSAHETSGQERQARRLWTAGMLQLSMARKIVPATESVEQVEPIAVTGATFEIPLLFPQNASPEASVDPSSTTENVCVE